MERNGENKAGLGIQWPITIVSVGLLLFVVGYLAMKPKEAVDTISAIFQSAMSNAGPFMLIFDVFLIVAVFYLAFSRYGRIKLGAGQPQYSMNRQKNTGGIALCKG